MNCLLIVAVLASLAVAVSSYESNVDHMTYLRSYGYLPEERSDMVDNESDVSKAIAEFQIMAGLRPTGVMNADTRMWMLKPRCGHHDRHTGPISALQRRVRRYTLMGTTWHHTQLTYKITRYTGQLSHYDVDSAVKEAFGYWAAVVPITFRKVGANQKSDIDIKFVTGAHGDGYPFDGPMGVLAHAYQPENGRAHFDNAEKWVMDAGTSYNQFNIMQVMCHEFGHLLGMGHSSNSKALMAPFYAYKSPFRLHSDDIRGIQSMYGRGNGNPTTETSTRYTTERTTTRRRTTTTAYTPGGDICSDPNFDAATIVYGTPLGFKGSKYYDLNRQSSKAYSIGSKFPGAPSNLDAALTISGQTMLIKGSRVYAYKRGRSVSGYPKSLSECFSGAPSQVDAAFVRSGTVYLVQGSTYYSGSARTYGRMSVRRISSPIRGTPANVGSAFHWSNYATIMFSGRKFYTAYGQNSRKVSYTGSTASSFLGC